MTKLRKAILLSLYGAAALSGPTAFAQSSTAAPSAPASAEKKEAPAVIETLTVVGSRRQNASSTDTTVPVDLIPLAKISEQGGNFDLAQTLANISPSFNSTRQTGADGADLVDSAALRGLGSDQTLVLVNGKRRHTTALVNLFGARNRGNTGTDMNAIPLMAIENIQVLRDGAAAQYGSDAIAGVIDIGLKKRLGCEAAAGYSQYSAGDGKNYLATAYCGFKLGEKGMVGVTAEYVDRGRSNRAEADNPRIIGDTKAKNATVYINGEIPTGGAGKSYFTLGTQTRDASSAAFARGGVGSDDIPSRNSAAQYPNGFVPFINGDITDRYVTIGHRGQIGEWNSDLSQTYGYNKLAYNISNTINASIANLPASRGLSASKFDAGGFSFGQLTTNFDMNRYFDGIANGMNIAFGAEYRREDYKIFAGEPGSYIDADGVGNGGNAGSQGFPGFQPGDATNRNRNSIAAYLDVETDVTKALKIQTALRAEKYSDFGSTVTGKIAGSYKVSEPFLLRASASTGFRAPSLQQVYFSSTFTDFIGGVPQDVVLAPNGSVAANAAGIPKLKVEKSRSGTLGFAWSPTSATAITTDFYRIDIRDRIVLSGRFDADNFPTIGATLSALGVGQAQFFVNSVDTKTQGVDITVSNKVDIGPGKLSTFLAMNFGKTDVTKIKVPSSLKGVQGVPLDVQEDVILSARERLFIEQGGPRSKITLGFEYATGPISTDLKIIHYGTQTLGTFSGPVTPNNPNGAPNARYAPKTSADLSFTYSLSKDTKITVGGNNIFNVKPSKQDPNETDNGFVYDSVQFGLNGAAYFARFWQRF